MNIVRIEDPKSGKGLFRAQNENYNYLLDFVKYEEDINNRHRKFPSPAIEFNGIEFTDARSYYCGFKSIYQLNKWITKKELKEIISVGFKIYSIQVPDKDCVVGKFQILFKKDNAVYTDITAIFN